MKYYGIDWAIFLLLVCQIWFLGEKYRFAFLFGVSAAMCGIFFGYLIDSIATIVMNIVCCVMYLMAYYKWDKN